MRVPDFEFRKATLRTIFQTVFSPFNKKVNQIFPATIDMHNQCYAYKGHVVWRGQLTPKGKSPTPLPAEILNQNSEFFEDYTFVLDQWELIHMDIIRGLNLCNNKSDVFVLLPCVGEPPQKHTTALQLGTIKDFEATNTALESLIALVALTE